MDEETSIFMKKYKQILKFKSQAIKKKLKIHNNNDNIIESNKKNNINILPKIKNLRNSVSSQSNKIKYNEKNSIENTSINKSKKSQPKLYDIYKIIDTAKNNRKEYRKFISQQSDISPKKNIKIIKDTLYQRLLKKVEKDDKFQLNNSTENSKINSSIDANKNKPVIKLPFLVNIKSRYNNYNKQNNKKISTNKSLVLSEKENLKIFKKSRSTYKTEKITKKKEKKYYYLIIPGNNGKLVEKCLLTRPNWEKIEDPSNLGSCNLIWTPLSQEINFSLHGETSLSQIINHFECHNEISNKKNLFVNLIRYCEYNRINLFSFYPLTIILNFKLEFYNEQIEGFKQLYYDIPTLIEDKNKEDEKQTNYSDYFRVNLIKRIGKTQKLVIPKSNYIGKNVWLLKRINLNRGREIKVLSDIGNILNEIEISKKENKFQYLIIQKYIEAPFLYNRRKFDIRIWVLFSYISTNYKFEVYVFKEGHLKACSETFNLDSDDLFVHLTNYSVQKYNKNFSKIEIGNEISFETFQKELDKRGDGKNFKRDVLPKINKIISITSNA